MANIKEYQVNVAGDSNGLVIPSGHRIVVEEIKGIYFDGTNWCTSLVVRTYTDNTYTKQVENDIIELDMCIGAIGATLTADGVKVLAENVIEPILDEFVGPSNYITI